MALRYCLPPRVPKFTYDGLTTFEEDGTPGKAKTVHEMRRHAEGYHALFAAAEL
ncbi:hypothetical protein K438DRAFT_1965357 [Mycena galopus ATCC 62051]|nr:hypothetical protein K438DRAFT_1965357 [Mycena galopus ATCC 62051]